MNSNHENQTNFLYKKLHLSIHSKLISIIGAGGKTSTMYRLAREYASFGKKVLCTTSTHILIPPPEKIPVTLFSPVSDTQLKEAFCHSPIVAVGCKESEGKLSAVSFPFLCEAQKVADLILCEADGSKMLPMKVPASHEPALVPGSDAVIIVAGLSSLHKPLQTVCHRSELAANLLGCHPSSPLGTREFARLIYHPQGLMKDLTNQREKVRIFLNQSDTLKTKNEGEEIKKFLLEQELQHIFISSLQKNFY